MHEQREEIPQVFESIDLLNQARTREPLSESGVSLNLARIQDRCANLMLQSDNLELSLEDPAVNQNDNNPYNQPLLAR